MSVDEIQVLTLQGRPQGATLRWRPGLPVGWAIALEDGSGLWSYESDGELAWDDEAILLPGLAGERLSLTLPSGLALAAGVLPVHVEFGQAGQPQGLPLPLIGASWLVGAGGAYNVPSLGSDLLSGQGDMEAWLSGTDLTYWTETVQGTSLVERYAGIQHGGTYCTRISADASGSLARITYGTGSLLALDDFYRLKMWVYTAWPDMANGAKAGVGSTGRMRSLPVYLNVWTELDMCEQVDIAANWLRIQNGVDLNSARYFVDDVTLQKVDLATCFAVVSSGNDTVNVGAGWVFAHPYAQMSGVVCNLNDPANPTDFIIAQIFQGTSALRIFLRKCVAGAWTTLIDYNGVTYVEGAILEIRRLLDSNDYQVWYNGAQVGDDQTVNEARIVKNKYHGLFDASGANVCERFFIDPVVW